MNNREIAIDVFKHPLIQEILKRKLAEASIVNRLIVEEIMSEDELEEAAKTPSQTISAAMTKYIKKAENDEQRLALMDQFMEKLADEALLANLIPNWDKRADKQEIIERAKTWKSRNHTKLQQALSQADSGREVQQVINNTAKTIEKQVIEPGSQSEEEGVLDKIGDAGEDLKVWLTKKIAKRYPDESSQTTAKLVNDVSTVIFFIADFIPALKPYKVALTIAGQGAPFWQMVEQVKADNYAGAIATGFGIAVDVGLAFIPLVDAKFAERGAKAYAGLIGTAAYKEAAKSTNELTQLLVSKISEESLANAMKNISGKVAKLSIGKAVQAISDWWAGDKVEAGVKKILEPNSKYQGILNLAYEGKRGDQVSDEGQAQLEKNRKAVAYFIYFLEEPLEKPKKKLPEVDLGHHKGDMHADRHIKEAKKRLDSILGSEYISYVNQFIEKPEVQAEFQKVFTRQEIAKADQWSSLTGGGNKQPVDSGEARKAILQLSRALKSWKDAQEWDVEEFINNNYKTPQSQESILKAIEALGGVEQAKKIEGLKLPVVEFQEFFEKLTSETGSGTDPVNPKTVKKETKTITNPKVIKKQFTDKSQIEQSERDQGLIDSMDEFFGQTDDPKKFSFINRFFLKDQATMLWTLVNDLNKVLNKEDIGKDIGKGDRGYSTKRRLPEEIEKEQELTIPWSNKQKVSLKREISAFVDLLNDAKKVAEDYGKYASQSSIDARYDGSSLKKFLSGPHESLGKYGILGEVQIHCGLLIDYLAKIMAQSKKDTEFQEKELDEAKSPEERKQIADVVEKTYNKLGMIYVNSLKPSLMGELDEATSAETEDEPEKQQLSLKDADSADEAAQNMLDLITKDPNIAQYFPRGIINKAGRVVTIDQASKVLESEIKALGKILRDLYVTVKDEKIAPSHITRIYLNLQNLANAIYSSFNVPPVIKKKSAAILDKNVPKSARSLAPTDTKTLQRAMKFVKDYKELYERLKQYLRGKRRTIPLITEEISEERMTEILDEMDNQVKKLRSLSQQERTSERSFYKSSKALFDATVESFVRNYQTLDKLVGVRTRDSDKKKDPYSFDKPAEAPDFKELARRLHQDHEGDCDDTGCIIDLVFKQVQDDPNFEDLLKSLTDKELKDAIENEVEEVEDELNLSPESGNDDAALENPDAEEIIKDKADQVKEKNPALKDDEWVEVVIDEISNEGTLENTGLGKDEVEEMVWNIVNISDKPVRPPHKSDFIGSPHEEVELEKISDSRHYQKLNKSDREAIDEFIKEYHNFRKPIPEARKDTSKSSMTPKGYEKNLKGNLSQLQADLDLPRKGVAKILSQMPLKLAQRFRWLAVNKPDLIADLTTVIMKGEPEATPSLRSKRKSDYRSRRSKAGSGTIGGFEEQISNKLEPIIEKMLQEY